MECLSSMWNIVPCLWDSSAKHAAYVCHLHKNMGTLRTEIGRLRSLSQDVKDRVEDEEGRHMRRTREVNNWLERARVIDEEFIQLEERVNQEVEKKCLGISCCPRNCRSSYNLGKKVIKKLTEIRGIIEERRAFDVFTQMLPPPPVDELPMETTVGIDSTFKSAWRRLQDKDVGIMGLYGSGGIGKTTLLKKINNEFSVVNGDLKFDVVIWIVVSKTLDLEKVQEVIRAKISISDDVWNNKSEDLRAAEIFKVLKTRKFVLMLDDLWEPIELSKIGVPCPNESNMCKVVFTTRSEEVCHRMNARESMRVDCLPPDEAFKLFCIKVGEDTLSFHRDIRNLANIVAAECQGLPLALITTGGAMAGRRNPQEWRHAIKTLQSDPARFSTMEGKVFQILRYSYDNLENDTLKKCFIYCSLFPEDHDIFERMIIELWVGEGYLGEYNNLKEARAQGEYIISTLKRVCLLEDSIYKTAVRMHDVIRDMALWLSGEKHVVQVGDKWTERNGIGRWKTAQRIALWNYSGTRLTEVPNCPNLVTLLIRSTELEEIPTNFFDSMEALRVLDMSMNKKFRKLPKGIGSLINLQYLNLETTEIYELPTEVAQLKNLRSLLLRSRCRRIPKEVMESLSSLQVFSLMDAFDNVDDMSESESRLLEREILEGLMCLEHLEDLFLQIRHASNVSLLKESPKLRGCLRRLHLYKVDGLYIITAYDQLEFLWIEYCKELEEVEIEVKEEETSEMQVFEPSSRYLSSFESSRYVKLHNLLIKGCPKICNLTSLVYAPNLQTLNLWHCDSMEEIVSEKYLEEGSEVQNLDTFSSLVSLVLLDLPSLRSICPHTLLFPCLETINVIDCPNLKKLPFDSNTANETPSKKIKIEGEESWWNGLVWKSEATKQLFAPNFEPW